MHGVADYTPISNMKRNLDLNDSAWLKVKGYNLFWSAIEANVYTSRLLYDTGEFDLEFHGPVGVIFLFRLSDKYR